MENSQCTVNAADSRVAVSGDRVTVEFAVRFAAGWRGSKLVYAYANSFGDTRNTGWREVGSWLVGEEAAAAGSSVQPAGTVDPNDNPTKDLDRSDTDYHKFLRTNAGATELTHSKGVLRFTQANGRKTAMTGAVTHQDQTGKWVANTPLLSETKQGWRLDGTSNGLIIRKKGLTQHEITQTYTDFTTKHDSTLTLTVPSLVYDKKQIFHFAEGGLTWDVTTDITGAFNLAAKVAAKRGKATYAFDVSSSEGLAVDAQGNLIGDKNVKLSRAMMYPKSGKAVACAAWTYSKKDGASFVCDDLAFTANQLPYRIDPSSHTYTDTGSYTTTNWNDSFNNEQGGNNAIVDFNTSGLVPTGGAFVSSSCGYDTGDSSGDWANDHGPCCEVGAFNNAGTTRVTVRIHVECDPCGNYSYWADISNVRLTINYNEVAVSVSPTSATVSAGLTQQITATVTNSAAGVTWSISPNVGSVSSSGLYTAPSTQASQQTVTVTATSVAAPQTSASATLTVLPSVNVSVAPTSATMYPARLQQFTATVTNAANMAVTWSVSPAGRGGVNSAGVYTSPARVPSTQTATITATSVLDPSRSASATVTLQPNPAGTAYGYYVNPGMSNPNLWTTASGVTVSTVVVPDLTSNYEVRATVHGSYTLYARATISGGTLSSYYGLFLSVSGTNAAYTLVKVSGGTWTTLATFPGGFTDGMTVRLIVRGNQILVYPGTSFFGTFTDPSLTSGQPGVAAGGTVQLGTIDGVEPGTVSALQSMAAPHAVDLQWTGTTDDTAGIGMAGYRVYRHGGGLLGTVTSGTQFTDETAQPGASVSYDIVAFDQHNNAGTALVTGSISVPSTSSPDPRRTGLRSTGSYWGAAGEQIDVQSGNLNFTVPLVGAKARGGWGATFVLSYNSQMWRKDASGNIWKLGQDVGYGLGWKLQAGSIRPVFNDTSSISHYVFSDSTGAEYRLDVNTGGVWTSKEGIYPAYDAGWQRVYFPDGSFWVMSAVSGSTEADAGTQYPAVMQDTNGNQLS